MKVFDGFLYNGESKMLNMRLNELCHVVDFHILVEATVTFTGLKKEPDFKKLDIEEKFSKKIIHVLVEDSPITSDPWMVEKHHRNAIKRGLPLNIQKEDILLISDIDEIPNPRGIQFLGTISPLDMIWVFFMDFYYYDFSHKKKYQWTKARAIQAISQILPQDARDSCTGMIVPGHGGWHLSYFMDPSTISSKIQSFSHLEFNTPNFTDISRIQQRIETNQDLFERGDDEEFIDPVDSERPIFGHLL